MPNNSSLGRVIANSQKSVRASMEPGAFGYPLVDGTATRYYDCTSKSLEMDRQGELLLEGAANATSIDQRLVSLSPTDFTSGSTFSPPNEGWDCTYQGNPYTIKKVLSCERAFGVPVALPVEIFRKTASASDTVDALQLAQWPAPPE